MRCITNTKLVAAALVAVALFSGTAFAGKISPACENCPASSKTATAARQKPPVVAVVNGVAITLDDFNRELGKLSVIQKAMVATPKGRQELVDSLVTRELAVQQAARTGFDSTRKFKAELAHMRKSYIANEYMTKEIERLTPLSDAEIKKYYEQDPAKYSAGERIRASNLQLNTEDEANAILAQLKAGANYEDLARRKSVDAKSSASGGDRGWFDRGSLGEPFDKAVAGLKPGEITEVLKTRRGFNIVKITDIRPPGIRPLDEAAPLIREEYAPGQRVRAIQKVTQDLRQKARVSINEELLAGMAGVPEPESKVEIIPVEQSAEPPKN